jgi:hypothetical protein
VHAFLDELYLGYLRDRFKPFTYGSSWILEAVDSLFSNLLVVPWSWLVGNPSTSEINHTLPNDCGLRPGTSWHIRNTIDVKATGLAVHDKRLLRAIQRSPKAEYLLRMKGAIEERPIVEVSQDYQFRFVINNDPGFHEVGLGMAIVQTEKPLPEEELEYWLRK